MLDTQNNVLECRLEIHLMLSYIQDLENELHEKKKIIKRLRKKIFFKRVLKPSECSDTDIMDIEQ